MKMSELGYLEIWTVERVKELLPDVKVKVNGQVVMGQVRGRKLAFAGVRVGNCTWEYSWSAIVNSLNHDRPLNPED
jgi:hypothetical protein